MANKPAIIPLLALSDATIFTGEAMVEDHCLIIQDGKVKDIVGKNKIPPTANVESYGGHILVPGFIDTQVNGGANLLLNSAPTAETCMQIAKSHQKYGTTRLLPTIISDDSKLTGIAIKAIREARKYCSNILGIHIEGPHLSTEKRGIHNIDYIRSLTPDDLSVYYPRSDEIMLITLAPENVTSEQIKALCDGGAIVSIGHSNALAEQVRGALDAGASGFTHLFNAMSMMTARLPGVAGIALDDESSWCGLIVDNHHVSPEMVRLAVHAKASGKVILVSDAMPPSATNSSAPFKIGKDTINVENGRCVNQEHQLAGTCITISDAVRNCIKLGIELQEALRMASANPAAFLRLDKKLGKLLPGYIADVVALDFEFKPRTVWVEGVV